jgi:outer membrane protein TolC
VGSYEKRLEAAKLAAAAAKALYERGKASSFDVVRAEDDLLAAELGLAGSRADYLSRVAELDLVSGRPVNELLPGARLPDVKSELQRGSEPGK